MDLKKNEEYILYIDDMGKDGEGIGHIEGYALFVKGALIGEKVRVSIMKMKKQYGFARLLEVLVPSSHRCQLSCACAGPCGGCSLQHMDYQGQLLFKEKKVKDCLTRLGGVDIALVDWQPIIGMQEDKSGNLAEPWHYRNKAQFPVRADQDGKPVTGFFAERSHRLIPMEECRIQHPVINQVLSVVMDFLRTYEIRAYNEERHKGLVRHIYVRRAYHTGQVMVCLVVNGDTLPFRDKLVEALQNIPGITSIYLNLNTASTNVILGDKMKLLWGEPTIMDYIGDICYRISPQSFYQVNPVQTEKLYQTALDFADLHGGEKVWDLYCGIGTISLFLARKAGHVTGVEIVPEAIENAKANAAMNGIDNVDFYCGAAEDVVTDMVAKQQQKVDVVVVDPPRKGCDRSLLDVIVRMQPEKVVYVSCDPATLARDVRGLGENGYGVKKVRPCDMFPQGGHVETVVLMSRVK